MEINGKRCSCWWCDGGLRENPLKQTVLEDWGVLIEEGVDDYEHVPVDMLICESCDADVLVTREYGAMDVRPDMSKADAPYDRNRCPKCGGYAIWQSDFNYDDVFGEGEGEGMVSYLTCERCGTKLEYSKRDEDDNGSE